MFSLIFIFGFESSIDTNIRTSSRVIGSEVSTFHGLGTLQRFIHKTGRWKIRCHDGTIEKLTDDQLDFLESCDENEKVSYNVL